jgi:hypothetical protein
MLFLPASINPDEGATSLLLCSINSRRQKSVIKTPNRTSTNLMATAPTPLCRKCIKTNQQRHSGDMADQLELRHGAGEGAREPTLGPKEPILRTHSMVNMAVKMRLRSLNTSMNSSGAP